MKELFRCYRCKRKGEKMSQLYITDSRATIGVEGGRIQVKYSDGLLHSLPIESVEGITILGRAQITTACIGECLKRGIAVQYYSSKGAYFGKLSSTQHVNTKRQKQQVRLTENEGFALKIAKNIFNAKINNQITILRRYSRSSGVDVSEQIQAMKNSRAELENCNSISAAMGHEGYAARMYFKGLNELVTVKEFHFNGRNRRPPKDAFNSMLSLGYSLIMNDIYGAIDGRGLSPYFGFIHQDREKHPTLASDLVEEWRAVIVDSIVMSLVNGHEITIGNFYKGEETGGVFFDKEGLRIFIDKIENRLNTKVKYLTDTDYPVTFRKAIDLQVLQLCKAIEQNDAELYHPVIIR